MRRLLKDNPRLRDSDQWLIFAFWETEGLRLTDEQKLKLASLTTAETITRARRELRAELPGSKEVEKVRYQKFVAYTNEYGEKVARIKF